MHLVVTSISGERLVIQVPLPTLLTVNNVCEEVRRAWNIGAEIVVSIHRADSGEDLALHPDMTLSECDTTDGAPNEVFALLRRVQDQEGHQRLKEDAPQADCKAATLLTRDERSFPPPEECELFSWPGVVTVHRFCPDEAHCHREVVRSPSMVYTAECASHDRIVVGRLQAETTPTPSTSPSSSTRYDHSSSPRTPESSADAASADGVTQGAHYFEVLVLHKGSYPSLFVGWGDESLRAHFAQPEATPTHQRVALFVTGEPPTAHIWNCPKTWNAKGSTTNGVGSIADSVGSKQSAVLSPDEKVLERSHWRIGALLVLTPTGRYAEFFINNRLIGKAELGAPAEAMNNVGRKPGSRNQNGSSAAISWLPFVSLVQPATVVF